jgi:Cupredoxin-like domain
MTKVLTASKLVMSGGAVLAALGIAGTAVASTSGGAASATVKVTLTDRAFRVTPATLQSGKTLFVVRNTGQKKHMFAVSGPGVKGAHTVALAAGSQATLAVQLRPGSYMFSDPVGLGEYSVQYVSVVKATSLTGTGTTNTVTPIPTLPPMCGGTYAP